MTIYKISSPNGYAFVASMDLAVKSLQETYPAETVRPTNEERKPPFKWFSRMGSGWFLIESEVVHDTPQRLMPFKKV